MSLPERQQTLRNAIRWSYDLLTDDERFLFRLLSLFASSFTVEFAEKVFAAFATLAGRHVNDDIFLVDGVESLIDKSLLYLVSSVASPTDEVQEPRLAMLETIRAFGREALIAHSEFEEMHYACATCYASFVEQAQEHLAGSQQAVWLNRLEQEHDNVQAEMAWMLAASNDEEPSTRSLERQVMALQMASALGDFWLIRGHLHEGWNFLDQALQKYTGGVIPSSAHAYLLSAQMIMRLGDLERAETLLEQSKHGYEELKNDGQVAAVMRLLGWVAHQKGQTAQAYALYEQALARYQALGEQRGIANTMHNMAFIQQTQGDYAQARLLLEEVVARQKALKNVFGTFSALYQLAEVLLEGGEHIPVYRIHAYIREIRSVSPVCRDYWGGSPSKREMWKRLARSLSSACCSIRMGEISK